MDSPDPVNEPLAGIRVIDLCSVVSGPMAAVVLADQGADVIKIEPPGWGDGIRSLGTSRNGLSAMFSVINRNKRSVAIDLRHPRGPGLVRRLAASADVVMQNYRPGRMDRLGLGWEDLQATNPELVYGSISGVGEVGPLAEQRVFDYVIQGLSGVIEAQTTQAGISMVRTIVYDKVTALMAAQGITAALLARERGAGGRHVRLSMLDAGIYFNWPDLMYDHSFVGAGVEHRGELADLYDVSRTRDGFIVSHRLGGDVSEFGTEELLAALHANDIPAARANRRADVLRDPQVRACGLLQSQEHPRGGTMLLPRAPIRFGDRPWRQRRPSPELGEHTAEVLGEVGVRPDELQALAREGVIG